MDKRLKPTIKVDRVDVLKEHPSFHRVHLLADTHEAGTQVHVHAVQGVGHGVHGVDHKLDLALLLVLRVSTDPLVTCSQEDRSWRGEGIKFQETQLHSQCPRVCPLHTCALPSTQLVLYARSREFAFEVVLPEFCKPHVPPVVFQRPGSEVLVEPLG